MLIVEVKKGRNDEKLKQRDEKQKNRESEGKRGEREKREWSQRSDRQK